MADSFGKSNEEIDHDDAPPLSKEWFENAAIKMGDEVLRPAKEQNTDQQQE